MSLELNACDKLDIALSLLTKEQEKYYGDKVAVAEGEDIEESKKPNFAPHKDNDSNRDLAIKVTEALAENGYLDICPVLTDPEEWDFSLQDTIHQITNEHFGVVEE
jgi:hypothetical protein